MESPKHKQQLIQQIHQLQEAIATEKAAVAQLKKMLHAQFQRRWPEITIAPRKNS
jgi:hypothetical protein